VIGTMLSIAGALNFQQVKTLAISVARGTP